MLRYTLREDVTLCERTNYIYVCSSAGTMRLKSAVMDSTVDTISPEALLDRLPSEALSQLVARGLVLPVAHEDEAIESAASKSDADGDRSPLAVTYQVAGTGALPALIAHLLRRAGKSVLHARRPSEQSSAAIIVPLDLAPKNLEDWVNLSLRRELPIITYLATPSRILIASLRPPVTPCPVCIGIRIRARFPWQDIADLPLGKLMGTVDNTRYPAVTTAASLAVTAALSPAEETDPAYLRDINVTSLTVIPHPLLHLPYCPACKEYHDSVCRELEERHRLRNGNTNRSATNTIQHAVDPLTGIVGGVDVSSPHNTAAKLTCAVTYGEISTKYFSAVQASAHGGAVKLDPTHSRISALGEALERYASGVYRTEHLIRATLQKLGPSALDPRELPLGSQLEYDKSKGKIFPFNPSRAIEWALGRSLTTQEIRYVPACAVYVPYKFPSRKDVILRPISTGLGAGSTPSQALTAGLLEIIERDAFAITWLNRLEVPTIDLQSLPDGPAKVIFDRLTNAGITVLCKETTTDVGIPAVLLSSRQEDPKHGLIVAHSTRAGLNLVDCIQGALEELEQSRDAIRHWISTRGVPPADGPLRTIEDFFSYYCHVDRLLKLEFLGKGPMKMITQQDIQTSQAGTGDIDWDSCLAEIVRCLDAAGYEPIGVDITPIDVLECGVRVARAIVPGLQPVAFSCDFRYLGSKRAFVAPVAMGLRDEPIKERELNLDPQPGG